MSERIVVDTTRDVEVEVPAELVDLVRGAQDIVVLTGAGMSAESGVPTFRDAQTGLWAHVDPMTMATPEAFEDDPEMVHEWYRWRAEQVTATEPNAGHRAVAELAGSGRRVRVFTQNVDDLHERGGSTGVGHLHGSLFQQRCADCEKPFGDPDYTPVADIPEQVAACDAEGCEGLVRPGIVWFGEALPMDLFDEAVTACESADVLIVIGTSGVVYPVAGLPVIAFGAGVPVVEINPDETQVSDVARICWRDTAARALPALVAAL